MSAGCWDLFITITQAQEDGGFLLKCVSTITGGGQGSRMWQVTLRLWGLPLEVTHVTCALCLLHRASPNALPDFREEQGGIPYMYLTAESCKHFATSTNGYHVSCQKYEKSGQLLMLSLRCLGTFYVRQWCCWGKRARYNRIKGIL